MAVISIQPTYPHFEELDGTPLESGYIYIGLVNLNPETSPATVYWDFDQLIAASQPIRTINGRPSRSGTPARMYIDGNYSMTVRDKNLNIIYSELNHEDTLLNFGQITDIAELRTILAATGTVLYVQQHTTAGDGGHGNFRGVSGAAPGAYVDNRGTIIVPTGGDGSAAWLRQNTGLIHIDMFGIKADGTDDSTAINAAFAYAKTLSSTAASAPLRFREAPIVDFGFRACSVATEIVWPSGVVIRSAGAELIALTNGMTVLRTEDSIETVADYGTYGCRSMGVIGKLNINGNAKASHGFIADTTALSDFTGINISGCTYQRFTGLTGTATAGSAILAATSATTNVNVGDAVRATVGGTVENNILTVIAKTANSITFDNPLDTTGATVAEAVGCGAMFKMVQQGDIKVRCSKNGVGIIFTSNVDGLACSDLTLETIHSSDNEHGVALNRISGSRFVTATFQHNNYGPDLSIGRACVGNSFGKLYAESVSDAAADAVAAGRATYLQSIPMIYSYGASHIFENIRFPTNPALTTWRRLMKNLGDDTIIGSITTNINALNVNPARALDYAPIEQSSTKGAIYLLKGFTGQTTITSPKNIIIDETGSYNPPNRASAVHFENGLVKEWVNRSMFGAATSSPLVSLFSAAEVKARAVLTPGTLQFGDGVNNPDAQISRSGADVVSVGQGDSLKVRDSTNGGGVGGNTVATLQLQGANNTIYHLWVDSAGKLRIHNALGVAENAGGTIVGTQT